MQLKCLCCQVTGIMYSYPCTFKIHVCSSPYCLIAQDPALCLTQKFHSFCSPLPTKINLGNVAGWDWKHSPHLHLPSIPLKPRVAFKGESGFLKLWSFLGFPFVISPLQTTQDYTACVRKQITNLTCSTSANKTFIVYHFCQSECPGSAQCWHRLYYSPGEESSYSFMTAVSDKEMQVPALKAPCLISSLLVIFVSFSAVVWSLTVLSKGCESWLK